MKHTLVTLICIAAVFGACKKHDSTPPPNQQYESGTVVVGLKGTATIETAFDLANSYNLSIRNITGYVYTTPYPKDSIAPLAKYLNTKKYIDTFGWKATVEQNVYGSIWVIANYQFMDNAAQQDWIGTKTQLQLTEYVPATSVADSLKYMVLTVPVGQEQHLADTLRKDPNVTWAVLSYYQTVQL